MMLHPATAHFAIALPIVATVFGLVYLYNRDQTYSKIFTFLTLFATLGVIAASLSGVKAGPEILEYLSRAGRNAMIDHRNMGLFLSGALILTTLLALFGHYKKRFNFQVTALVLLLLLNGVTLFQGKTGGILVYNHGQPFGNHLISDALNDTLKSVQEAEEAEDEEALLEVYEDAIDDIITYSEDINSFYGNEPQVIFEEED